MHLSPPARKQAWRTGRLNWIQKNWLRGPSYDPSTAHEDNLGCRVELGRPASRDAVVSAISDIVARHEALRTTVTYNSAGIGVQTVDKPTATPANLSRIVQVVPVDTADSEWQKRKQTAFDLGGEWPVHFVVAADSRLAYRVLITVDHSACDAWGVQVLHHEILARTTNDTELRGEPNQPLDVSRWEDSPAGQLRNERGLQYWHNQLVDLERKRNNATIEKPPAPNSHTFSHWTSSRDLRALARSTASRLRIPMTAVFLHAAGQAINEIYQTEAIGLTKMHANRFGAADRSSVSLRFTQAPVVVTRGLSEASLMSTAANQLRAYRIGHVDPERLDDVVSELPPDVMEPHVCGCLFDYMDYSTLLHEGPSHAEEGKVYVADTTGLRGPRLMFKIRMTELTVEIALLSKFGSVAFENVDAIFTQMRTAITTLARERPAP